MSLARHPDGLAAAKACRPPPGFCLFCEEPLPTRRIGRPRDVCDRQGCTQARWRAWRRDNPQPIGSARALRALAEYLAAEIAVAMEGSVKKRRSMLAGRGITVTGRRVDTKAAHRVLRSGQSRGASCGTGRREEAS